MGEAGELAKELPEGETTELEAEPVETDNDPLWVGTLEEPVETVTMTDPKADLDGIGPDEVKVTNVEAAAVVPGAILLFGLPVRVDRDRETERGEINGCVEVETAVELAPAKLLGALEGIETGG